MHLDGRGVAPYHEEMFLLAAPHVSRVKTLSVSSWRSSVSAMVLQTLVESFSRPVPLLEKLKIELACNPTSTLPGTLFNGDLSSLRELSLAGVLAPPSWGSPKNLAIFDLSNIPGQEILLTRLLDFSESTPPS